MHVKTQRTTRLVPGTIKFTIDGDDVGASIPRAHVTNTGVYAVPIGAGRWQPVLAQRRTVRPGRHTLTLRRRANLRWITRQVRITAS